MKAAALTVGEESPWGEDCRQCRYSREMARRDCTGAFS
jgi:hypothetical protein